MNTTPPPGTHWRQTATVNTDDPRFHPGIELDMVKGMATEAIRRTVMDRCKRELNKYGHVSLSIDLVVLGVDQYRELMEAAYHQGTIDGYARCRSQAAFLPARPPRRPPDG